MHAPNSPPPDASAPSNRDGLVAWAVAATVVVTILIGTFAPASHGRSGHGAAAIDASCAEWSDGCTICQRYGEETACSLPGIACVPQAKQCLRHSGG
ncbi:hypothetical protein IPV08_20005 [Methylobacterium sp. SD274]|uniref:hypothetical protein n=1 Tax=Methylobacterium sp. SD274 TaxID=2782009 RepID=UPI001A95D61C|nr:hypothetical protein [Methylobacterium sp. SD274]MBO1022248.1 hypothetical protein [Methylobacterium sp. SD274]